MECKITAIYLKILNPKQIQNSNDQAQNRDKIVLIIWILNFEII